MARDVMSGYGSKYATNLFCSARAGRDCRWKFRKSHVSSLRNFRFRNFVELSRIPEDSGESGSNSHQVCDRHTTFVRVQISYSQIAYGREFSNLETFLEILGNKRISPFIWGVSVDMDYVVQYQPSASLGSLIQALFDAEVTLSSISICIDHRVEGLLRIPELYPNIVEVHFRFHPSGMPHDEQSALSTNDINTAFLFTSSFTKIHSLSIHLHTNSNSMLPTLAWDSGVDLSCQFQHLRALTIHTQCQEDIFNQFV
ncbi:hypothetical protein C8J56DRAFT_893209 [Mycena floridula]|nr:hypothetical protein C8J56DRAFT_893209 [Mycena floridula]